MTLFIIIGVLVPMVYTMQLNIKNEPVTKAQSFNNISFIYVRYFSNRVSRCNLVTKQAFPLLSVAIGSIFTGIVWGLLLSGSVALIRFLSNAFGRK